MGTYDALNNKTAEKPESSSWEDAIVASSDPNDLFAKVDILFNRARRAQSGPREDQQRIVKAFVDATEKLPLEDQVYQFNKIYSHGYGTPTLGRKGSLLWTTCEGKLEDIKTENTPVNLIRAAVKTIFGKRTPSGLTPA
jgi:hypothetical protein